MVQYLTFAPEQVSFVTSTKARYPHDIRVKHGPQEFVPEGMFDDSVDLVVWGHEHDCRIIPEPVAGKNYYITQPGSSVATSLADGEAIEKSVKTLSSSGIKLI